MNKIKLLVISLALTFLLAGCSLANGQAGSTTNNSADSSVPKAYELSGNLNLVTDYSSLKGIFDTKGIVVFYEEYGQIDSVLLNSLKELADEYKVKVYCVKSEDFSKAKNDANINYVYNKVASNIKSYKEDGTLLTPDFYEIKDGKIANRIFGINIKMDFSNPSKDDQAKLKELYRSSFVDLIK